MSVDPALAHRLLDAGYEKITWKGHETYAAPGEWVASFRNLHGSKDQQFAAAVAKVRKAAPRVGLRVERPLDADGTFRVDAPEGMSFKGVRAALSRVRGFDYVEPNFAVWAQSLPDDFYFGAQYGLNNTGQTSIFGDTGTSGADIDAPEAWDLLAGAGMPAQGQSDVVVGLIDTGVDYNHPDIAGSMWVNPFEIPANGKDDDGNGFVDDVHGADFADLDGDPMDDHNHGTHVAGILAATPDNGIGTVGVAPHVKIMALRFLSADGFGGVDFAIQALNYAMDMKARGVNIRVTNNSWGGADFSQAMDDAIRRSADAGMLFVAAAGNGDAINHIGFDVDAPGAGFYPASQTAPSVISVAATDSRDRLASFSNFGAEGVDLAAPGVNVVSEIRDGGYQYFSGTSMATPLVTGVAAMAWTLKPDATWQEVRDAIFAGVDKLSGLAGKMVTGGRLNAISTLRHLLPTAVVGRHVFYNNSAFDSRSAAASPADDNGIAADKAALLPGAGPATFANYTSYSKGINGVMVDVRNLPAGDLTADDFALNLGTDSDLLASWQPAPTPRAVSVRRGAGVDGSDRVTLTFADGAIKNTWLRVTVLANEHTGLAAPDASYFGNAVGETGDNPANATVNLFDIGAIRSHLFATAQPMTNPFDLDRDGRVNSMDLVIAFRARTEPALPLITLPLL
jgi:subtilisin family serine protease